MQPEGGLPYAQEPATCACPEPDQYNPCPLTISWTPILILSFQTRQRPPSGLFSSGLTSKTLHAHIYQHLPHAQPISIYGNGLHRKQISPDMNPPSQKKKNLKYKRTTPSLNNH
jgi:hypothetical protein